MQKTMAIVKNGHKREGSGEGRPETNRLLPIAYFIPLL